MVSPVLAVAQTGAGHPVAVPIQALQPAVREMEFGLVATAHLPAGGLGAAGSARWVGNDRCGCRRGGRGLTEERGVVLNEAVALTLNGLDAAGALDLPGIGRVLPA